MKNKTIRADQLKVIKEPSVKEPSVKIEEVIIKLHPEAAKVLYSYLNDLSQLVGIAKGTEYQRNITLLADMVANSMPKK